jgi:ribosome-associated heat shock protein Hsp15
MPRAAASAPGAAEQGGAQSQRLDQWLWFARVVKSRTLAATLISEGKIRLNRQRVEKPSQAVKPGDVITSGIQREVRVLRVVAIGKRRGPAAEAQALYDDLTVVVAAPAAERRPVAASREAGSGRPTKKERRLIDKLRGRD